MYGNTSLIQQTIAHNGLAKAGKDFEARRRAAQAFWKAHAQGSWNRFWSRLRGRNSELLDLNDIERAGLVSDRCYAGRRDVPLSSIQGSEGRERDFDRHFYPLRSHNMDRWVGVAAARLRGVNLPPVELVQVGEIYYVRDGHHRISVASAMGQVEIDAEVTVWRLNPA